MYASDINFETSFAIFLTASFAIFFNQTSVQTDSVVEKLFFFPNFNDNLNK